MQKNKIIDLSTYRERRPIQALLAVPTQTPRLISFDCLDHGCQETKSGRRALGTQEFRRRIACGDYQPDPHAIAQALIDHFFDDAEGSYRSR